jgi:CheY-like chemotaxis protein
LSHHQRWSGIVPRILVIDSDLLTIEAIESAVPTAKIIRADSIADGMQYANAGSAEIIILSADEPTGYSACRKLKKDATLSSIPLILISATATPEQFADHARLPTAADAYLLRPFEKDELVRTLERLQASAMPPLPPEFLVAEVIEEPMELDGPPDLPPMPDTPMPDTTMPDTTMPDTIESPPDLPLAHIPDLAPEPPPVVGPSMDFADEEPLQWDNESQPAGSPPPPLPSQSSAMLVDHNMAARDSELEQALEEVTMALEAITEKYQRVRATELELKREITDMTERLHNQKMASRRVEEAQTMERERYEKTAADATARAEALEAAALAAPAPVEGGGADPAEIQRLESEIRRLKMMNEDMRESLEVIRESLIVPMEIIERHLELDGGSETSESEELAERTPIAL